jgi:hypothetical protein
VRCRPSRGRPPSRSSKGSGGWPTGNAGLPPPAPCRGGWRWVAGGGWLRSLLL